MPKIHEYQGKRLLRNAGVNVPFGDVASTVEEVVEIAKKINKPMVIKSQIGATGRFKAGGIKFANTVEEAREAAENLLGKEIKGLKVEKVLVEEQLDIVHEFYAGIIINDSCKVKAPVLMFSSQGGVDVEEVAATTPEKVVTMTLDVLSPLEIGQVRELLAKLPIDKALVEPLSDTVFGLYTVFRTYDARSMEINPMVLTRDGKIFAADCRTVVDEASCFRHADLEISYPRDIGRPPTFLERAAWKIEEKDYRGVGYFVQIHQNIQVGSGTVGFHGVGGGGAMVGADALMRHGLKIANYADTSGNPTASKVYRVIKMIFSQPNIAGYVLMGPVIANQEQWHHAHALVKGLREELANRPDFPVIILLAGNKDRESLEILHEGLKGLPARIEIYGREYVDRVDEVAARMRDMVNEYQPITEVK